MSEVERSGGDVTYEQNWETFESEDNVISELKEEGIRGRNEEVTQVEGGFYQLGQYQVEFEESERDFAPDRVNVKYSGDAGPEWNRAKEVLTRVEDETSAESVMKKQEVIHLHGLIAQIHDHLEDEDSDYEPDMSEYQQAGVRPTGIYKDKWDHTRAALSLAEAVAEEVGGIPDHENDESWRTEREYLVEEEGRVAGHRI